ncbi:MAG TPA: thioredoxin family protein [Phycisphaerae bacterium]|nr:thioredoxin family protein [Phycisphaerae bacterium]
MGSAHPHSVGVRASTGYRILILVVCSAVAGIWYFGSRAAPSAVAWVHDYQDALRQAEASGRLVLLDFGADWCPPCQTMEQNVFSKPEFAAELEKWVVPLRVDLSDSPLSPSVGEVVRRYEVAALPTFVVVDVMGRVVVRREGTMSARQFEDFVRSAVDQAAGGRSLDRRN